MQGRDDLGTLADRGGDALDRAGTDIAKGVAVREWGVLRVSQDVDPKQGKRIPSLGPG